MARARADNLVIHAAGEAWDWALLGRDGRVDSRGSCAPGQPDWPAAEEATVLVDAARCLGVRLDLPSLRGKRLQQAMRWAVEEHLAGSAENEHVVAGERDDEGRLCCVSIAGEAMNELTGALAGVGAERMVPDALCLPWQPGEVSLAGHAGRVLVRWDDASFASFDDALAAEMIDAVAPESARWIWFGDEPPSWVTERGGVESDDARPLISLLAAGAQAAELNLLAGAWSPGSAAETRSRWLWVAGLAAAVVALVIGSAAVEYYQLEQRSQQLEADIASQFNAAFPEVGRIVRPQAQAERELARLRFGQAAGLLDLMHRVAPVLDGQEGIELDRLDYRDGTLELGLRAPDVAALDELEQRLRALDLVAEVQSASLDDRGASGRIRIGRREDA